MPSWCEQRQHVSIGPRGLHNIFTRCRWMLLLYCLQKPRSHGNTPSKAAATHVAHGIPLTMLCCLRKPHSGYVCPTVSNYCRQHRASRRFACQRTYLIAQVLFWDVCPHRSNNVSISRIKSTREQQIMHSDSRRVFSYTGARTDEQFK